MKGERNPGRPIPSARRTGWLLALGSALIGIALLNGCGGNPHVTAKLEFVELPDDAQPALEARCTCSEDGWKLVGRGGLVQFRLSDEAVEDFDLFVDDCLVEIRYLNGQSETVSADVPVEFARGEKSRGTAEKTDLRYTERGRIRPPDLVDPEPGPDDKPRPR